MDLTNNLELKSCPHCNISTPKISLEKEFNTMSAETGHQRVWAFYVCQNCGGGIIGSRRVNSRLALEIFPKPVKIDKSIPDKAKIFLEQAIDSIRVPAVSIMLSASSIDAMLQQKGFKDGNLYNKINKAAKNHFISDDMYEWAQEIRLEANYQQYAENDTNSPTEENAKQTIEFAETLGEFLYILPHKIKKGINKAKEVEPQR